jgi:hypothetical protein
VNWVLDWARKHGKISTKEIKHLQELRKAAFEAKTPEEKARTRKAVRLEGTRLRKELSGASNPTANLLPPDAQAAYDLFKK